MAKTLTIKAPEDYSLSRDFCSYGYFLLAPNRWDVRRQVLARALEIERVAFVIEVSQKGQGEKLTVRSSRSLSVASAAKVRGMLTRMLRLDESAAVLAAFHAVDPRWKKSGRGRLMRSPTMFEDVVKTVTSCNVQWPSTITMNRRLCEVLGEGGVKSEHRAFPTAKKIAGTRPQTLRARCRTGYRDARIVELGRLFATGAVKPAWFEDPATPEDQVYEALLELPGVGPYAAANMMQLLGRYARLPCDTETVRHGKSLLGFKGSSAHVMKKVRRHYEPFGEHAFRSYWFEMWEFYESKHGASHTWERDSTGKMFTAAQLKG
ncbi:MAG: hypothetical protein AABZ53_02455 [Planctomycetota bacterium]